jgi:hypothetical protein
MSMHPPPPTQSPEEVEIRIVSHSNLFYWWPVWAIGFLLAFLTWLDGHRMIIVPDGAKAVRSANVEYEKSANQMTTFKDVDVVIALNKEDKPERLPPTVKDADGNLPSPIQPKVRMALSKNYGIWFALVLLLVIVITNVPLRGMWSVVIIIVIVMLSIIFTLAEVWDKIAAGLALLDIHMNAMGYLAISLVLFAIWVITFYFFDRQMYMVFTPGQLRVCTEIGGGEEAFDTMGMTIRKERSDLFRHWILGLGSGDLVVNTSGAHVRQFDLHNVLFVGRKVEQIADMLREKAVVRGR